MRRLQPRSGLLSGLLWAAFAAGMGGCSDSFFQQPYAEGFPPATPAQVAAVHQPDALRADLDALVALHERVCPDPYLRVPKTTIEATRDRLKAEITEPMDRAAFLRFVMELQAAYLIDHMIQEIPAEDLLAALDRGELLLPFRARPVDGGLTVVAVAESPSGVRTGLVPGDRIERIGDQDSAALLARFSALVPQESERFQAEQITDRFRSLAWVIGIRPPVEVEWTDAGGVRRTEVLAGVGRGARAGEQIAPTARPADRRGETIFTEEPYRCAIIDGDILAIDFPTMDRSLRGRWQAFLERAFAEARDRGCVGVIVDVRRNGGGDSSLGDDLLAHLSGLPYRMTGSMEWRKSAEGTEVINRGVKPLWRWLVPIGIAVRAPEFAGLADGESWVVPAEAEPHPRREPTFAGPACLLIGAGTFSSAMMLADACSTYGVMTTVGEPTGGLPTSLGELGWWDLPASGIRVQFCQKKFLRASGDGNDLGPVLPAIPASNRANDGSDPACAAAIALIRARP